MHDFQGYFSRTFQVLEFLVKNPGLSRRRGNPVPDITQQPDHRLYHTLLSTVNFLIN